MTNLILLNKPYGVLCQFKASGDKTTLAKYIASPGFYPAGRLDEDSEGLLLLTNDGQLQHLISDPKHKLPKQYWVQVDGQITLEALDQLNRGVVLRDGKTKPAVAQLLSREPLPPRVPPVRFRANIPTSWISLTISEGKNRQVRRMTASVGFPTLRLYRAKIGAWEIQNLAPGETRKIQVHVPKKRPTDEHSKRSNKKVRSTGHARNKQRTR